MYDMLPFPNITATDAKEQANQINNYLIQFKETLEFILTNISVDNLSQDLINKLNDLGAEVQKSQTAREEEVQQMSNRMLTVSDVINSPAFDANMDARQEEIKNSIENQINVELERMVDDKIPTASEVANAMDLRVNYDTGHLEY